MISSFFTYDDAGYAQATLTMEAAKKHFDDEELPETFYSDIVLVDKDNVSEYKLRYNRQ